MEVYLDWGDAYTEPCECDIILGGKERCGQWFVENVPGLFAVHLDKNVAEVIRDAWNVEISKAVAAIPIQDK